MHAGPQLYICISLVLRAVYSNLFESAGMQNEAMARNDALAGGHAVINAVIYKLSFLCQTLFM